MSADERAILVTKLGNIAQSLPGVETKNMFGANGFCKNSKIFCMVTKDNEIVFKINNQQQYEQIKETYSAVGWSPRKGKSFGLWLVLPSELNDNVDVVKEWATLSHRCI